MWKGLEAQEKLKTTPQCMHHQRIKTPYVCITVDSWLPCEFSNKEILYFSCYWWSTHKGRGVRHHCGVSTPRNFHHQGVTTPQCVCVTGESQLSSDAYTRGELGLNSNICANIPRKSKLFIPIICCCINSALTHFYSTKYFCIWEKYIITI